MSTAWKGAAVAAALAVAGLFHFHRLDRLPPGVCYDGATLACFR